MKASQDIQTLPEAIAAAAEVRERVAAIEECLKTLMRIFHGVAEKQRTPITPPHGAGSNGRSPMPSTFLDRVEAILADQTKPIRPKTAAREYEKRLWPLPGKGGPSALYNNVSGALLYLRKTRKTVDRNDDGYFLKNASFAKDLAK